jgi:hypothetical protein
MAEEIMAYCVKEKAQKPMKDAHEVTLKNGKHAMQGTCASCGTKMMKFVSSKKNTTEPKPPTPPVEPGPSNAPAEHKPSHESGTSSMVP